MTYDAARNADLRLTETARDAHARLAQIARQQAELAAEAASIVARISGEPERAPERDDDTGADHKHVDTPAPGGLVALKSAAHTWRRTERNLKKIAQDHGALHKVGGRNMVDDAKLKAAIFGRL